MTSAAIGDFTAATREFVAGIASIRASAWPVPRAPGKWSPAQEAEHIALAHEAYAAQLAGGPPMRVVVTGWRRVVLRRVVMPWILHTGRFPRGARSPREARPSATAVPPAELTRRIEAAASAIVVALERGDRDSVAERLDHPYFGAMTAAQALRLTTVHTRHHLATMTAPWSAVIAAGTTASTV